MRVNIDGFDGKHDVNGLLSAVVARCDVVGDFAPLSVKSISSMEASELPLNFFSLSLFGVDSPFKDLSCSGKISLLMTLCTSESKLNPFFINEMPAVDDVTDTSLKDLVTDGEVNPVASSFA